MRNQKTTDYSDVPREDDGKPRTIRDRDPEKRLERLQWAAHDYPREPGEQLGDYLERLNVEAGIIPIREDVLSPRLWARYKDRDGATPAPKPPPAPPVEPAWMPFKEADDDLADLVPKEKTDAHRPDDPKTERDARPHRSGHVPSSGGARRGQPAPAHHGRSGKRRGGDTKAGSDTSRGEEAGGGRSPRADRALSDTPKPKANVHPLAQQGDQPGDYYAVEEEDDWI